MTLEERQLLEITARSLLKLEKDILGRVAGIEAVLHALFVTEAREKAQHELKKPRQMPPMSAEATGNTALALARLTGRPAKDERHAIAFPTRS
jgi:hypothetical protein